MLGLFKRKVSVGPPDVIVHDEKPWPDHYYEVHSVVREQPKDPTIRHIGGISFVSFESGIAIYHARSQDDDFQRKGEPFTTVVTERPTSRVRFMDMRDREAYQDFFKRERVVGIPPMPKIHEWRGDSWHQTRYKCSACHEYKSSNIAAGPLWGGGTCQECRDDIMADPAKVEAWQARYERERDDGIALNGWPVDFSDRNDLGYVRFNQESWDRRFDYPVHLRDGKGLIATGSTQLQFPDGHWAEWIHAEDEQGRKYMHAGIGPWDQPIPGETWWVKLHSEPRQHEAPKPEYRIVWPEQGEVRGE